MAALAPVPPSVVTRAVWARQVAVAIAVFLFVFMTFYVLQAALTPIVAGFILAYFLDPVIDFLERRRIPRVVAILFLLLFAIGILVLIIIFVVPRVVSEFGLLVARIGDALSNFAAWAKETFNVNVPIDTQVPINTTVPVEIDQTLHISAMVPLQMRLPVSIEVRKTALSDYLDRLQGTLRRLRDSLR